MLSGAVRNLIGRFSHHPSQVLHALAVAEAEPEPVAREIIPEVRLAWPPARLAQVHALWGDGFIFPGGEIETLRLARPLGASDDTSLLIVGVGSGGPAVAAAQNMGTWITGLEHDPSLLASAVELARKAKLGKKVQIKAWDPEKPAFGTRSHHHCLALDPLVGTKSEPILDALARVLRPGGQLVLTELAAAAPLNAKDPNVSRWADLENRDPADIPISLSVTRMLGRVGLDVRVAENISARHMEQALIGWRVMLRELSDDRRPTKQEAIQLIREAELWLLRRRMIRGGQMQMMRWHAISRVPVT